MRIQTINITPVIIRTKEHTPKKREQSTSAETISHTDRKVFAYQDYNISFSGRTPENFYEQDFNRENMPDSMKAYLEYDYDNRRHIPPEQMMKEVFKYIEIADSLDEVKKIYPDEKLFKSLHENYRKNRTSILGEIKLAKEISDEPLLKNGNDNFGLYLLKKIYLEGKTLKEINKDFYEKDLNDAYKGIISRPIDAKTTASYGIQYPNLPFWHSFIATREEYKKFFVTLPKNSVNPAVKITQKETDGTKKAIKTNTENSNPPKVRKYKIKEYQKKQIANDIKDAKGNIQEVEKKIRKRFAQDDPEASFIVKYLSPIMAVAADRVHLSEEMKLFCEYEKTKGLNGNEEYMFSRFWKQNPEILNNYAQTITDTIDLFEDIYGDGGIIPINKNLEIVKPDSENQRVIDHVSSEFLELLDYTQTIMPEREERYKQHDIQQKLWEEHFINRYGKPAAEKTLEPEKIIETSDSINKLTEVETQSTEEIQPKRPENIQKEFIKALKIEADIYPDLYAEKYVNYMKSNKNLDDNYKLAYMYYAGNETYNYSTLAKDDFIDRFSAIEENFYEKNETESILAKCAIIDILAQNNCRDARMYSLYAYDFPNIDKGKNIIQPIIQKNKQELNRLYRSYLKPIKPSEQEQIVTEFMHRIINYKKTANYLEKNTSAALEMMRDACKNPIRKKSIETCIQNAVKKNYPQMKLVLKTNNLTEDEKNARFENAIYTILADTIINSGISLLLMVGRENFQKYINDMSEDIKIHLIQQEIEMPAEQKDFYNMTLNNALNNPQLQDMISFVQNKNKLYRK